MSGGVGRKGWHITDQVEGITPIGEHWCTGQNDGALLHTTDRSYLHINSTQNNREHEVRRCFWFNAIGESKTSSRMQYSNKFARPHHRSFLFLSSESLLLSNVRGNACVLFLFGERFESRGNPAEKMTSLNDVSSDSEGQPLCPLWRATTLPTPTYMKEIVSRSEWRHV